MIRFSGSAACLYALGEPYRFRDVYLEDCGDGWDWRAPEGLRYWIPDELLTFQVLGATGWDAVEAEAISFRSGRVSFGRCLSGPVRASGACRTLTLVAEGGKWDLSVESFSTATKTLAGSYSITKIGEAAAVIRDCPEIPIQSVQALLPHGAGAFTGFGPVKQSAGETVVRFNQEGVQYVRC